MAALRESPMRFDSQMVARLKKMLVTKLPTQGWPGGGCQMLPDVARWICHGCRWGTQRSVVSNNIGGLFPCQHPGLSADFQQGPKKGHKTYEHVAKMAVEVTTQLYLFSPSFAIICKIIAAPFKKDKKRKSHPSHNFERKKEQSTFGPWIFYLCWFLPHFLWIFLGLPHGRWTPIRRQGFFGVLHLSAQVGPWPPFL